MTTPQANSFARTNSPVCVTNMPGHVGLQRANQVPDDFTVDVDMQGVSANQGPDDIDLLEIGSLSSFSELLPKDDDDNTKEAAVPNKSNKEESLPYLEQKPPGSTITASTRSTTSENTRKRPMTGWQLFKRQCRLERRMGRFRCTIHFFNYYMLHPSKRAHRPSTADGQGTDLQEAAQSDSDLYALLSDDEKEAYKWFAFHFGVDELSEEE